MSNKILEIKDYTLSFIINNKKVKAVDDLNIDIKEGELVALVGESGCGKSLTALSILSLLPTKSFIDCGSINFKNQNLLELTIDELNEIRGNDISIVFQEPMSALNPLIKVGKQILQTLKSHNKDIINPVEVVKSMLEEVGLSQTDRIYNSYPHQLSGGMRQRVMIAMALINNPLLLIADEPTTALDVTIQAQILDLIRGMSKKLNTAVLFISHDLALVKNLCDRVYVMYASMIVETASVDNIINEAKHPYTKALLKSLPTIKQRGTKLHSINGIVPKLENRVENACPFAPRCEFAKQLCFNQKPCLEKVGDSYIRCHFHKEINQ